MIQAKQFKTALWTRKTKVKIENLSLFQCVLATLWVHFFLFWIICYCISVNIQQNEEVTGEKKWNGNISAKVWKFAFSEAVSHSALRKGEEKGEERENEKKT